MSHLCLALLTVLFQLNDCCGLLRIQSLCCVWTSPSDGPKMADWVLQGDLRPHRCNQFHMSLKPGKNICLEAEDIGLYWLFIILAFHLYLLGDSDGSSLVQNIKDWGLFFTALKQHFTFSIPHHVLL